MIRRTTPEGPETDNASVNGEDRSPQLVDIGGLLSASNGPSRLEKGEQPFENTSAQGPDEIGSSAEKEDGKDVELHEAPALRGPDYETLRRYGFDHGVRPKIALTNPEKS
ncbi:hypothetical protein CTRI78_v007645 [Colletotrichum trifolii]|uniref:Uncharacterized protein n=1 Tax=Colletotrichum trifolii TaxID=5466 RepID=A0A4R8R9J5_COLTR|nr:hypothetical protein CTRI78_v007645 [Colletotrichum trifolii]